MIEKIKNLGSEAWGLFKLLVAICIVATVASYFLGYNIRFAWISFFLGGIWALRELYPKTAPIRDVVAGIGWYVALYASVLITFYVFFNHTAFGVYRNWAETDGSLIGTIRVFGPILVLTAGSIFFVRQSSGKNLQKWAWGFLLALMAIGLLMHGFVEVCDRWLAVKAVQTQEAIEVDRYERMKTLGLYARLLQDKTPYYRFEKNGDCVKVGELVNSIRYPLVSKEEKKDGIYTLVRVYIPDANGEFTNSSPIGWVRVEPSSVRIETRGIGANYDVPGKIEFANGDGKFTVSGSGSYRTVTFHVAEEVELLKYWDRGVKINFSANNPNIEHYTGVGKLSPLPLGDDLTPIGNSLFIKCPAGAKLTLRINGA